MIFLDFSTVRTTQVIPSFMGNNSKSIPSLTWLQLDVTPEVVRQCRLNVLPYPPEYCPVLRLILGWSNHRLNLTVMALNLLSKAINLVDLTLIEQTSFLRISCQLKTASSNLKEWGTWSLNLKSVGGELKVVLFSQHEQCHHTNCVSLFTVFHQSSDTGLT